MRLSGKEKPVVARPPAQVAEAADGIRGALFRNDCQVQAFVLAELVDGTTLPSPPPAAAVLPLPPVPEAALGAAEAREAREWLAGLEESQATARETERRQAEEKLAVLREEHRARVEERRRIMEAQLMQRLEAEHVAFK